MADIHITKAWATNFRGESFTFDLTPFTGFHGETGAGKSTRIRAALLALFGADGELSVNMDLWRRYATPGAGYFGVGCSLSDGTSIDRLFREKGKGVDQTLTLTPINGDDRTNTEKQARIYAILGLDDIPVLTSDLRGKLKDAATRSDFLADLCPTKWAAEEIAAALGGLAYPGARLDIIGLAVMQEALENEAKTARASLKEAEAAARDHDNATIDLDKMRRECPYSEPMLSKAEEEIGLLNADIRLNEEAAKRKTAAETALANATRDLAALPAIEEVNVENAEIAYRAAADALKAKQEKAVKEIGTCIHKAEKAVNVEKEKLATLEGEELNIGERLEVATDNLAIEKANADKLAGEAAAFASKEACPKCGYAFEDKQGDLKERIGKAMESIVALQGAADAIKAELSAVKMRIAEAKHIIAEQEKALTAKHMERDKAAAFDLDKHPDLAEPLANVAKAKAIDAMNRAASVKRAKIEEAQAQSAKALAEIVVADIETMKARRDALRLDAVAAKTALDGLKKKAASLEASALSVERAGKLKTTMEEAAENAKAVKNLRATIIADSLEGFTQAAAGVHVDSKGRTFAVVSEEVRNRRRIMVGLKDGDGKFFEYDQLSNGEQLIFAAAFVIAVNSIKQSSFRPLLLDDLSSVSPTFRNALLERVGAALKAGLLTQALTADFEEHTLEGTTWIAVGAQPEEKKEAANG